MNDEESIVAYPHEIKFIDKNGGAISYYVDRKVSNCVKELQDKLSKVESENRQKDIDKLQLQSNWYSLKECIIGVIDGAREELNTIIHTTDSFTYANQCSREFDVIRKNLGIVLDKMNELEGREDE